MPLRISIYNPSNILARAPLVETRHMTEYSPTKNWGISEWYSPIFKTARVAKKIALGKLFASRNRYFPRTNIRAYFRANWTLLFIYSTWSVIQIYESLLLKFPYLLRQLLYFLVYAVEHLFIFSLHSLITFLSIFQDNNVSEREPVSYCGTTI